RGGARRTSIVRLAAPDDPAWQLLGPRTLVVEDGGAVVIDSSDPAATGRSIEPEARAPGGPPIELGHVDLSADGSTVVAQSLGEATATTVVIDVASGDRWTLPEPAAAFAVTPDGSR